MISSGDAMFEALHDFIVKQAKSLGYTEDDCVSAKKIYHRDKYGMYLFMNMPDNNIIQIVDKTNSLYISGGISDCKEED